MGGALDLGVLAADDHCACAATFTTNKIHAACIDWDRQIIKRGRVRADLLKSAGAEEDPGRGGELEAAHYPHPGSSGKQLAYFTLERGSAIMSATASRQTG